MAFVNGMGNTFQLDGQKAFLTGKLKTKGNMMFATKLSAVLAVRLLTRPLFHPASISHHISCVCFGQATKAKAKL